MPPVNVVTCDPLEGQVTLSPNGTTIVRKGTGQSDLQALLYIVITLLFYSMGIIVGIISYLKREKREMQEDKTYEEYLSMKQDPFLAVKSRRVQQFAERIKFLEERKRLREEEAERLKLQASSENTSGTGEELNSRRFSRISLLPPDTFSMQFLNKGCQTDDTEKDKNFLSSRARKIVKILTPTPSRRHSMVHFPRGSKKKSKDKYSSKTEISLSSLEGCAGTTTRLNPQQRSPSLLTPTICLHIEDMSSKSSLADSTLSSPGEKSLVPYIDASTDDDNTVDRSLSPLMCHNRIV